jgi:hypothetical protein
MEETMVTEIWVSYMETGYSEPHFRVYEGEVPLGFGAQGGARPRRGVFAREAPAWQIDFFRQSRRDGRDLVFPALVIAPQVGRARFAFVFAAKTPAELEQKISAIEAELERRHCAREERKIAAACSAWRKVCAVLGLEPEYEDLRVLVKSEADLYKVRPLALTREGKLVRVTDIGTLVAFDNPDPNERDIRRLCKLQPAE